MKEGMVPVTRAELRAEGEALKCQVEVLRQALDDIAGRAVQSNPEVFYECPSVARKALDTYHAMRNLNAHDTSEGK